MAEPWPHGRLAGSGTRVIIVGTARHVPGSELPSIPSVEATVTALERMFVDQCGVSEANVSVIRDPAHPTELGNTLTHVAEHATDALVLYFVCHGLIGDDNALYLATRATQKEDDVRFQAMEYALLQPVIRRSTASSVLVVLDCCFAGRASGVTSQVTERLTVGAQEAGFYLLTAVSRDEPAWARPEAEHTAFSGELIRLLRDGDPAGPAQLTLNDVYEALHTRLRDHGLPEPHRQIADNAGAWVLAPNPARRSPASATDAGPVDKRGSPYRGLAFFRPEDADYFFGREKPTRDLIDRLSAQLTSGGPLVVTGASGVGKSSLLRAGLIADLQRRDLPSNRSSGWSWTLLTPGANPLDQLALRLAGPTGLGFRELVDRLTNDPDQLAGLLRERAGDGRLLLVVDQFEELFTACHSEDSRQKFVRALAAAARLGDDGAEPAAVVVLGLRAGFFGDCARNPDLVPALHAPVVVAPMNDAELREAIEEPARKAGLRLDERLTEQLLKDLAESGGAGGSLPLLSHALLMTWDRREGDRLTLDGYLTTGGIQRAIEQSADQVFDRFEPNSQQVARELLLRLVHIGERTGGTRRRLPRTEVRDESTVKVYDELVKARLLTEDRDKDGDRSPFVEITHDALLRAWPRLRGWIETNRAELLIHQRLADAARTWREHQRDPEHLYSRRQLARLDALSDRHPPEFKPGSPEDEFLRASRHQGQRLTRRRRLGVAMLALALVVALAAAGVASQQWSAAEHSRKLALSLATARTADDLHQLNPTLAMQLGVTAYRIADTADSRGAVLSSVALPLPAVLVGHDNAVDDVAIAPSGRLLVTASEDNTAKLWDIGTDPSHPTVLSTVRGHRAFLYGATFSPDGTLLATASFDGTARLWDVHDPRRPNPLSTLRHTDAVRGVAFSPDGATLATASNDGNVRLWDVRDPGQPRPLSVLNTHQLSVRSVSFRPDGKVLATASQDKTAKLWDLSDLSRPVELHTIREHTDSVRRAVFSPDGTLLATASNDRTAKLWDVRDPSNPGLLASLEADSDAVRAVAFSPDARTIATASADNTVRLWDISDRRRATPTAVIAGHMNSVNGLAFTPDGRTLATASTDKLVKLWNVADRQHPGSLFPAIAGPPSAVRDVAVTGDGRRLAAVFEDGTARLWDIGDPRRPVPLGAGESHGVAVRAVAFSPDGRLLATASEDGSAKLWDVSDPAKLRFVSVFGGHTVIVNDVAFSPDGRLVVTAEGDNTAKLWDVSRPDQPIPRGTLEGHQNYVFGAVFSPDGRTVATASEDRTAKLWDVADPLHPRLTATLEGHGNVVNAVAFAPDGNTLATASEDRTVKVWDIRDRKNPVPRFTLEGHRGPVLSVAFSPDGRTLATTSEDRTARVWDLGEPGDARLVATLYGHTGAVSAATFAAAGVLVTGSSDHTARLWKTDPEQVAGLVCASVTDPATPEDWAQALPDVPYQPSCPSDQ